MRQHLSGHGHRTLEAGSAAEALALAGGKDAPDLVLLDIKLPDADGLSLLDRLHAERPRCRIIVLSAYATPETTRWALEHGASSVLYKPCDLEAVAQLVDRTLSANGHAPPQP